jgi:hypothetical protein
MNAGVSRAILMKCARLATAVLAAAAATVLWSCASGPGPSQASPLVAQSAGVGPSLKDTYAELGRTGGKVFVLDPAVSAVRIYAFRGGPAAKVGHNHVLAAPRFSGFFHLPTSGAANARFDLEFRLDELELDNVEQRASLGSAFASVLSPEAIEGTREHMLGESNLEADKFPFVRIHSLQVSGESPRFAAKVLIEMHGQTREVWVPLSVSGSLVLRQSDFGARPYSVVGGMISVKDEVIIDFRLADR